MTQEVKTKQEVVREGIFKVLFPYSNADHYSGDETVRKVLDYLHSQGVVIKGNSEIPFCGRQMHTVEPLIKRG